MPASTLDERLAQTFVELADTLVAGFDLMEFLHTLAERCVELLGVNAAGLFLADNGGLKTVAASTEQVRVIELFQLQNNEGPCIDAYRSGQVVPIRDLHQITGEWPHFAPAALEQGFAGVHAIPMRLRDQVIGALNLFSRKAVRLDEEVAKAGQALVDVATIGILQERASRHQELVNGQLTAALGSRVIIEQGKGILAERHHVSPDQAFELMRNYARSHNQRLTKLAAEVVLGQQDL